MTIKWNKITEVLPEEGKDYLVWNGRYFFVSRAEFYHAADLEASGMKPKDPNWRMIMDSIGYFAEFGSKEYFNDKKIYWAELPVPPND